MRYFHDEGFVEENLDVEIQKSVARKYPDTRIAKFKTIEPFTAATLTYKGHYVKLPEVYEAMARWIADNHYKIAGPHFNIYHVSPETQEDFEDMITEVWEGVLYFYHEYEKLSLNFSYRHMEVTNYK